MYIKRLVEEKINTMIQEYEKPIVIIGARQTGKTTTIKKIIEDKKYVYINLFDSELVTDIFNENNSLNVDQIVRNINTFTNSMIDEETIIVMDEIQTNPHALASLKSFNEDGKYKVIALGSNLGSYIFHNTKRSFPVGQIKIVNMYPISFSEYVIARGYIKLHDTLIEDLNNKSIDTAVHNLALKLFDEYVICGGMPEVVKTFIKDGHMVNARDIQRDIILAYKYDFGKYSESPNTSKAMSIIYSEIPRFLEKDNQKFIFSEINYEYKQLKQSFNWLIDNKYVDIVNIINSDTKPLSQHIKDNSFKLFINDIGLLLQSNEYDPVDMIREKDKRYFGFMMENYIANVLVKHNKQVFNFKTGSNEIDFLVQNPSGIIAIEVKSGTNTKSKSLNKFIEFYNPEFAIKLTRNNLSSSGNNMQIPLYAIDYIYENNIDGYGLVYRYKTLETFAN